MRVFSRAPKRHWVIVHDVRPSADDRRQFDPYFIALCECRWFGDPRASAEEALRDAQAHVPGERDDARRPLG
ncbi:MAG TPA: hypothetical protein VK915_11270 [Gaiellaceae bacterium]|nr:hypothetical protein [Gaiellaceae bacterium]